jgi:hypothetical protein
MLQETQSKFTCTVVVGVGVVNRVVLPLAHIRGEWLAPVVVLLGVVGFAELLNELSDERVGAGCVVGRI